MSATVSLMLMRFSSSVYSYYNNSFIMLKNIEPQKVWDFFFQICEIPHPSKHEEELVNFLKNFAIQRNLSFYVDNVGNVVIRKEASDTSIQRETVVLQSHLDMVCEKLPELNHDFLKDSIKPVYENGWVKASGTTLGADNGIGVATMLAILDSNNLIHGKLEALFTIDEETGLTGAIALTPEMLEGKILLNLDSEDDGEIYIGCAGGVDTIATLPIDFMDVDTNHFAFKLTVSNLEGGHSGDDIGKGLHSANVVLAQFLLEFSNLFQIQIADIYGGNLRNAIARDAYVVFVADKKYKEPVRVEFNVLLAELEEDITRTDAKAQIRLESSDLPDKVFSKYQTENIISVMHNLPHGVIEWSERIDGFVKTSTNFASTKIIDGILVITTSQRSSSTTSKEMIAQRVVDVFSKNGFSVLHEHDYPGWESAEDSKLIQKAKRSYFELFNEEVKIKEIHAGLECGLLADTFTDMEIISFGPTIKGAHSPNERIEVRAVERFWEFLIKLLDDVSKVQ